MAHASDHSVSPGLVSQLYSRTILLFDERPWLESILKRDVFYINIQAYSSFIYDRNDFTWLSGNFKKDKKKEFPNSLSPNPIK